MDRFKIFSNSSLKIIAIITMFIDHLGFAIVYHLPQVNAHYQLCRDIGRIAFPIFCFLLVEGFRYTHSRAKYARNLLLFAFLSEIPFDLVFNAGRNIWHSQNVMFTLLIGLLVIWGIEYFYGKYPIQLLIIAVGLGLAYLMHTDYDWKGILLITVLYVFRQDKLAMTIAGTTALLWEWKAIFAFLPINLYNGKRGWMKGPVAKYALYLFYPAHLLLLAWIRYHYIVDYLPQF